MARILMIVGDFVEDYEVMVPFQCLQVAGHQVDVICPDKQAGDFVATAVHDFEGHQTYSEKPGHRFVLNASFDAVDPADYVALVLPGGRAPEYLRLDQRVLDHVHAFRNSAKPIAAVCHGVQILTAAGVVDGIACSGYPSVQPEIEAAGGTYVPASAGFDNAHVDQGLVTAPAWPAHPEWLKALLKLID